jgi:hypothetical protein
MTHPITAPRIAIALWWTAAILVLAGIPVAMTGAALNNVLFDVGMWMQISGVPLFFLVLAFYAIDYLRLRGAALRGSE